MKWFIFILVLAIVLIAGCTQQSSTNQQSFSSLKELFGSSNPVGANVNLHGIALVIHDVSTTDFFLFTDDERVMNNPNYIVNGAEYEIIIYNTPKASVDQNLINITGSVVNCERSSDGKYCINATKIDIVSPVISA